MKKHQRELLNDMSVPESLKKLYLKACEESNKESDINKKRKIFLKILNN